MAQYIPGKGIVEQRASDNETLQYIPGKGVINANNTGKSEGFSWPRFLGEQALQGQLDNPDVLAVLPQLGSSIVKNVAQSKDAHIDDFEAIPSDAVMSSEAGKRYYEKLKQEKAQNPPAKDDGFYIPSENLKQNVKALTDVDLSSQGEGDTAGKRIAGRAVRNSSSGATLGAFAGPLGSLTGAGVGALYGAGSQILTELNMNPLIADLVTAFGTTGAMLSLIHI